MEEGTKLICRKTLIQINKGKAYGRQGKATDGAYVTLISLKHSISYKHFFYTYLGRINSYLTIW